MELGRVLRDVNWRILYLRRRFDPSARILLSKINSSEAFRQVSVVGYSFREWVVTDHRLQFG